LTWREPAGKDYDEMTVRVGFVGCGGRAVREMMDLVQMPNVTMAAMCDISEDRVAAGLARLNTRRGAGEQVSAPAFTDCRRMLDAVDLDAVYVGLPPFAHGVIEHTIIDAGKAIFIEKPLAVDMAVAKEIDAHIREKGVINCVGYQWRYAGPMEQAREMLANIPIGLLIAIRLGGLPATPWWRVQAQSGGMLIEQHTHSVDAMRYLAGDVATVYAAAGTQLLTDVPNLDIADVNAASVTFVNGAVGSIVNSCAVAGQQMPNLSNAIHIVAKDLVLAASAGSLTVMRPKQERQEIKAESDDSNFKLNATFVKAVESGNGADIRSPYSDSLRTHAVTVAAVQSAREGRIVDVRSLL
jgi:myo-inositol 2-dehydrogenase/D-chiro-inositol 1-dehydrogenase